MYNSNPVNTGMSDSTEEQIIEIVSYYPIILYLNKQNEISAEIEINNILYFLDIQLDKNKKAINATIEHCGWKNIETKNKKDYKCNIISLGTVFGITIKTYLIRLNIDTISYISEIQIDENGNKIIAIIFKDMFVKYKNIELNITKEDVESKNVKIIPIESNFDRDDRKKSNRNMMIIEDNHSLQELIFNKIMETHTCDNINKITVKTEFEVDGIVYEMVLKLDEHGNEIDKIITKKNIEQEFTRTESIHKEHTLMFPAQDQGAWYYYKKQMSVPWTVHDTNPDGDIEHHRNDVPQNLKDLVRYIFVFFLPGDSLINQNIIKNFLPECQSIEERMFYHIQMYVECNHMETYSAFAFALFTDEELNSIFEETEGSDYIRKKTDFMEKYMQSDVSYTEKLFVFACAEGIFFSNLFVFIFWLKFIGYYPNLAIMNEEIARDEGIHQDYADYRIKKINEYWKIEFNKIKEMLQRKRDDISEAIHVKFIMREMKKRVKHDRLTEKRALEILLEAVEVEDFCTDFIFDNIPDLGLSREDIKQYTRRVADVQMISCGFKPYFNVQVPESIEGIMDSISLHKQTNFYEGVDTNYGISLDDMLDWDKTTGRKKEADPYKDDIYY